MRKTRQAMAISIEFAEDAELQAKIKDEDIAEKFGGPASAAF